MNKLIAGLKLLRLLYFNSASKQGSISIQIAPTSACNYRCYFCGNHSLLKQANSKVTVLPHSIYDGLFKDLIELGTKDVLFAGNGEPLLSKHILKCVCLYGDKIDFSIMTNGSLLQRIDKGVFDKLAKLIISLNSGNGDSHKQVHGYSGHSQFEYISANIERLLKYEDSRHKLHLNYVITPENEAEFQAFKSLASVWGIGYSARRVDTRWMDVGHNSSLADCKLYPCFIGFIQPYISSTGNVHLCCDTSSEPFGNLYRDRFINIWQNEHSRQLRKQAVNMSSTKRPITQGCYDCRNAQAFKVLRYL